MSGKYQMTLTDEQIMLIANCVEDCHRFACGETELWNTIASMNGHGELRAKMKELHDFAVPELSANQYYDWAGSGCKDKSQKKFIAMTYAIYREILHKVVNAGVYKSHTLTCNEGGTPPRIAEVDEKNRKHKLTKIEILVTDEGAQMFFNGYREAVPIAYPELRKAVMIMLDLCTQVQRTIIQKEKEND